MIKQFYFKQFKLAYVNKVKWFEVLLYITDNSIKHQSFVYTQLKDPTVVFLTIQFIMSFGCTDTKFLFSGVTFHRPLIFLSPFLQNAQLVILYLHNPSPYTGDMSSHFSFFLSFFLSFWIYLLQIVSCSLIFLVVSRQKKSHTFLIFFWRHYNLPIWAVLGKTAYCSHHRHVYQGLLANWLVWFFLFLGSTFPLPRITWAYWPIGIHPSNRSLVARSCLPIHTPILGKQPSIGQHANLTRIQFFRLPIYFSWFARERERWERRERERERERESIFMSKIWIWPSPGSKFITTLGLNVKQIYLTHR